MKLFPCITLFILSPFESWTYVPREYPAIYTQQLGRAFLLIAFLVILWSILHYRLYRQKGWRYLFLLLIFFAIRDLDVFGGRLSEFIASPRTIGAAEGWRYFERYIEIESLDYLYCLGGINFILLNIGILFFTGLKEHLPEVSQKNTVSARVILPLLVDEKFPPVCGDEAKIRQLLINLLSNAVKFTRSGVITVTAHPSDKAKDFGGKPLFMQICASDTGMGMKEEDLRKIFEKFVQRVLPACGGMKARDWDSALQKAWVNFIRGGYGKPARTEKEALFVSLSPYRKKYFIVRLFRYNSA